MSGDATTIELLDLFGARLPGNLGFSLARDGDVAQSHPLAGEIESAFSGRAASLPYPRAHDVMWVTVARNGEDLRRAIEDLRCWILPSFGWEGSPSIVSEGGAAGTLAALLLTHAPQGYFRWHSRMSDTDHVIGRLAMMRAVIAGAPVRQAQLRPSLETLRRQFTLGLATGDRNVALQAIDEIDQRQLDTASNAISMRIRLDAALGDHQAIVHHPQLDDLLSMRVSQRVVESILLAHHAVYIEAVEADGGVEDALAAYLPLHDRLAGFAVDLSDDADSALRRMSAYDAATAGDITRLLGLAKRFADDPIIAGLCALKDVSPTPAASVVPPMESVRRPLETIPVPDPPATFEDVIVSAPFDSSAERAALVDAGSLDWSAISGLVAAGAAETVGAFLQHAMLMPDICDPGDGDFIVELFTDGDIAADRKKRALADQVLTAVIDAYICEERFPQRTRLTLYETVMDVWSSSRALSSDLIDGQMLLTMADALMRLDGSLERAVAIAITRWWEARPVRSRLAWLGEALELLSEESVAQDYLALWFAGAALIKVDHEGLSLSDRHLWYRLGRRFGLETEATDIALGGDWKALEAAGDPLLACSFKKIAIVSLHERGAREAAAQIEQRTQASVLVMTDHAAGEGTASAATADVILFVWGATKHAVYRAFDKVRDRLEYVQGTGSSSIVRALERRVKSQ